MDWEETNSRVKDRDRRKSKKKVRESSEAKEKRTQCSHQKVIEREGEWGCVYNTHYALGKAWGWGRGTIHREGSLCAYSMQTCGEGERVRHQRAINVPLTALVLMVLVVTLSNKFSNDKITLSHQGRRCGLSYQGFSHFLNFCHEILNYWVPSYLFVIYNF